jgi:hypothetical protein
MYITRPASSEIFSPLDKIHREVGRAKDLSAARVYVYMDECGDTATCDSKISGIPKTWCHTASEACKFDM